MRPQKYRKKPVLIEALQFTLANAVHMAEFVPSELVVHRPDGVYLKTLEGEMQVRIGDWVIKGVEGEFYPCKPSVFASTYEVAEGLDEAVLSS